MNTYKFAFALLIALLTPLLVSSQIAPQYNTIPASFDINSSNPIYALDINYNSIDENRQAFHLFLPDSVETYPLVIYIHGGGFTGGSRDVVLGDPGKKADIKYFLEQGVAYASIGYRLIATNQADTSGVIKCLMDAKHALQFIRYHAPSLHINPDKIVLYGNSAGAGTSLWLAAHPDMADPDALDPVFQSSSRVCAAQLSGSQATYDLYKWESEVYNNFDGQGTNYTVDSMANLLGFDRYSNFYGGLDSNYQILYDPALIQYRQDVDMLFHMSSDDPPLYVENTATAIHPSQNLFHHSLHGQTIYDEGILANVSEIIANIPALGINTTQGESKNEFLLRNLNACGEATAVDEYLTNKAVKVYPNPASALFTVELEENRAISTVEVFTTAGRLVFATHGVASHSITIPTDGIGTGIYLVQVTSASGERLIKKLMVEW